MKSRNYNLGLIVVPILIFFLGVVTLLSVSPHRAGDQFTYFLFGSVLYILFSSINYRYLLRFWKPAYFVTLATLLLVFIIGTTASGSIRWFNVGGVTVQPSEFAKIVLVLSVVGYIADNRKALTSVGGLVTLCSMFAPFFGLVLIQPDLGTALVLFFTFIGLLFYAGVNRFLFFSALFLGSALSGPAWSLLKDYQKRRILVFLNPGLDHLGAGYNVVQSIIAVGSGGLLGKGFGRGSQSHLEFLPAYWTDFIFASYAEEWGFLGVLIAITLFVLLIWVMFSVAKKSTEESGSILACGFALIFLVQFLVNVGMNLGVMPVTGIPFPLMTYGGSSLLSSMIMLGIVQNISLSSSHPPHKD
jgi:rod shape determining protein RodA